jgi:arabinogalactan oligomer/maltooligosaccharide transport system permease protein
MAMELPGGKQGIVAVEEIEKGVLAPAGAGGPPTFTGLSGTHRSLPQRFADTGWRHLVAFFVLLFALFPVYWVIVTALDPVGSLAQSELIPQQLSLENFETVLNDQPFWTWFRNTMVLALSSAFLTVMIAAFAAFAFSRLRFRGRRAGLMSLLLVQMFPAAVAATAIFVIVQRMGDVFPAVGLGTLAGLLLVYLGSAMGINAWLMKGFFDTIPKELDESAKMDGATHVQIFFKVILPVSRPILAVVFLLSFLFAVNEYLLASVLLRGAEGSYTVAVGLSGYVQAGFDNRFGPFAAGALIVALPVLAVFLFLQRYLVGGLLAGAVKG